MNYGNGQIYKGMWKENLKDGSGVMEYVLEGYTREGTWKENAPDGDSVVTFKNGEKRFQTWAEKQMIEDDVMTYAD